MEREWERGPGDTAQGEYSRRLLSLEGVWWKRMLRVQTPYRFHMRRLRLGFTLDLGCGLGRNLAHLDGNGVGVDHNAASVEVARSRGLVAFTPAEFLASGQAQRFDSLLFSHVAEHMRFDEAGRLLREYLPFVRGGGRVIAMTPQEAGYRSDPTHVEFFDFVRLGELLRSVGLDIVRGYSFPFPRAVGLLFKYNEFVVVARKR
jgi:SAM-dependent methyltransferase